MKPERFLLFLIPVILICGVLIIPAIKGPGPRRRHQCQNHLKNISLALYGYATDNNGFWPPAVVSDEYGKPMHSWRALILPYIDEQDTYDRYDFAEPWNGPNNIKLHNAMPDVFTCYDADLPDQMTGYMVINDPDAIFNGSTSTNIDDIFDGVGQTLLLTEFQNQSTHWLSPVDATRDEFKKDFRFSGTDQAVHRGGTNVSFAGGNVKFLSETLDDKTLDALISFAGREPLSDDEY